MVYYVPGKCLVHSPERCYRIPQKRIRRIRRIHISARADWADTVSDWFPVGRTAMGCCGIVYIEHVDIPSRQTSLGIGNRPHSSHPFCSPSPLSRSQLVSQVSAPVPVGSASLRIHPDRRTQRIRSDSLRTRRIHHRKRRICYILLGTLQNTTSH